MRGSIRLRLTLQYAVLFVLMGVLLLGLNYALVSHRLQGPTPAMRERLEESLGQPFGEPPPLDPQAEEIFRAAQQELRSETLNELVRQSMLALGVMAALAAVLGWYVAGRALRPVSAMTERANRISATNLDERISLQGPQDELRELADTFDRLIGRLADALRSQRHFAANASHELRTPLSVIRTEVDVTLADPEATMDDYRRMAEVVREATERSEQLVYGLLALARSEAGVATAREVIDLKDLAEEGLASLEKEIKASGLEVRGELSSATVSGDVVLVRTLVRNLLANAVEYNEQGGWIEVSTRKDAGAVLRVANSGPVVPASSIDDLFEPFTRRSAPRTGKGAGLGLSIVAAVAKAHDAEVVATSPVSGGLVVSVTFPSD